MEGESWDNGIFRVCLCPHSVGKQRNGGKEGKPAEPGCRKEDEIQRSRRVNFEEEQATSTGSIGPQYQQQHTRERRTHLLLIDGRRGIVTDILLWRATVASITD